MQINSKSITIGRDAPTRIPKLAYKCIPTWQKRRTSTKEKTKIGSALS